MKPKSKRGGARPGAGRKSRGKVALRVQVLSSTRREIRRLAKLRKQSQGDVVDYSVIGRLTPPS